MDLPEYDTLDGVALARLVARGEVTAQELVRAALTRADARDPALGALVRRLGERAAAHASATVPGASALAGVPTLLKDLGVKLDGVPTGSGTRHLQDRPVQGTSTCVQRLLDAGLTVIGKSNCAQLGLSITTEPPDLFPTRNPWDLERTAGGSSGGSAAAVAAGIVPLAHASDGGGSIRVPASCCGLVGLKPTRGRIPRGPEEGEGWSGLATEGVLSRSLRDTAAALDLMAGWEPGDPYAAPALDRPLLDELDRPPGRLRVALWADWSDELPSAPVCRDAAHAAGRLLEALGHTVEEAAPAFDRTAFRTALLDTVGAHALDSVTTVMAAQGRDWHAGDFAPGVEAIADHGRTAGVLAHLRGRRQLAGIARTVGRFLTRYDLILSPTLAQPPAPLGVLDDDSAGVWALHARQGAFSPFTALANATGEPAISLPLAWSPAGLPIGVMLHAPLGREDRLVRVAAQCESARPWRDRRPPLA